MDVNRKLKDASRSPTAMERPPRRYDPIHDPHTLIQHFSSAFPGVRHFRSDYSSGGRDFWRHVLQHSLYPTLIDDGPLEGSSRGMSWVALTTRHVLQYMVGIS